LAFSDARWQSRAVCGALVVGLPAVASLRWAWHPSRVGETGAVRPGWTAALVPQNQIRGDSILHQVFAVGEWDFVAEAHLERGARLVFEADRAGDDVRVGAAAAAEVVEVEAADRWAVCGSLFAAMRRRSALERADQFDVADHVNGRADFVSAVLR